MTWSVPITCSHCGRAWLSMLAAKPQATIQPRRTPPFCTAPTMVPMSFSLSRSTSKPTVIRFAVSVTS